MKCGVERVQGEMLPQTLPTENYVANRWQIVIQVAICALSIYGGILAGQANCQTPLYQRDNHGLVTPFDEKSFELWRSLHIETDMVAPPWVGAQNEPTPPVAKHNFSASQPATIANQLMSRFNSQRRYRLKDLEPPTIPASATINIPNPPKHDPPKQEVRLEFDSFSSSGGRPKVLFEPAVPVKDATGQAMLRPTVRLAEAPNAEILPTPSNSVSIFRTSPRPWVGDRLPSIEEFGLSPAIVGSDLRHRPLLAFFHHLASGPDRQYDVGVGRERLPYALFEVDSSMPLNNYRLRFDAAYGWEFPDRAEYLWSRIGGMGPAATVPPETSVDYQDIGFLMEIATPRMSVGTQIPLRFVNPTVVGNTGGLGDVVVTTKTLLFDGDTWQLTQILRTQMNSGTSRAGRGSGHISMEPGMIARYKWNEDTLIHSELKFRFPLGGDPMFSGEVLRYGFGVAKVLYDTDTLAVLPTLEFVGWSVLSGRKTLAGGTTMAIDGENIFNMYPGMRFVFDTAEDFQLFEMGVSSGFALTERHWYRGLLRFDMRWSF